jgi:hypothetical protein
LRSPGFVPGFSFLRWPRPPGFADLTIPRLGKSACVGREVAGQSAAGWSESG